MDEKIQKELIEAIINKGFKELENIQSLFFELKEQSKLHSYNVDTQFDLLKNKINDQTNIIKNFEKKLTSLYWISGISISLITLLLGLLKFIKN